MNPPAKLAINVIIASLALGVVGDALLRIGPWGINALLWTALLLATTVFLIQRHRVPLERRAVWMLFPITVASAGFCWRDSEALKLLDFGTLCVLLALAVWQARGTRVIVGGVVEQVWRLAKSGLNAAGGFIPLFLGRVSWPQEPAEGSGRRVRAVAIGVLLAFPFLVLFGALFMSADLVFSRLVNQLIQIDFSKLMSHLVPCAFCAWVVGGFLVGLLFHERETGSRLELPQFWSLGGVEIGVALGLLNLLFLSFILVQLRYLFGGANLIEVTPGLTYAEYARHGFFELVAVALLALPVMLGADWLLGGADKRRFRMQAGVLLAMLAVILASAWHRMRLYQLEFGWTEHRLYVTAGLGWLAVVFGWFALTVLRGQRERFAFGALVAGLALVLGLHGLDPDAWIVRQNLKHAQVGHKFDAKYACSLSADAWPVLAAAFPNLDSEDQAVVRKRLQTWAIRAPQDWRVWSWGRAAAWRAIETQFGAIDRRAVSGLDELN